MNKVFAVCFAWSIIYLSCRTRFRLDRKMSLACKLNLLMLTPFLARCCVACWKLLFCPIVQNIQDKAAAMLHWSSAVNHEIESCFNRITKKMTIENAVYWQKTSLGKLCIVYNWVGLYELHLSVIKMLWAPHMNLNSSQMLLSKTEFPYIKRQPSIFFADFNAAIMRTDIVPLIN